METSETAWIRHCILGLQPPTLQESLFFDVPKGEFVLILNVDSNHWCVVSNVGCEAGAVNVYDTMKNSVADATVHNYNC